MKGLFIALIALIPLQAHCSFVNRNLNVDFRLKSQNAAAFTDKWYSQTSNHFDRSNKATWQQRYRVNDQYYKQGGPILILISGESSNLSDYLLQKGLMVEIAQEHQGVMLQLEHRFYGMSHPTADTSVDNLKLLSVDQGLADLATFTAFAKGNYKNSKVFVFGGSYAGDMSAWFQLRYRHLVDGVFSASGPYLAQVDFPEYAQTIQRVAEAESPGCYTRFVQGIQQIEKLFKTDKATLKTKFRLCDDLTDNLNDLYTLIDNMVSPFARAIQYGDQDREMPFQSAWEVCTNLTSVTDPLEGLAKVNDMYMNGYQQTCLLNYDGLVAAMRNTSWESDMVTSRGWVWQTCTEFGWYQTYTDGKTNGVTLLPLSYFLDICSDVYGPIFGDPTFVQNNVDRTNIYYGAYDLAADHAVIWNGDYDPWSRVSILWPLPNATETYVYNVLKNSHCTVMRAPVPADSGEAVRVRMEIKEVFSRWISPPPPPTTPSNGQTSIFDASTAFALMLATISLLY